MKLIIIILSLNTLAIGISIRNQDNIDLYNEAEKQSLKELKSVLNTNVAENICSIDEDQENMEVYPLGDFLPSYFFRNSTPDGSSIMAGGRIFTTNEQGVRVAQDGIFKFDLKTGQRYRLDSNSSSDPVTLLGHHSDQQIVSIPNLTGDAERGMKFSIVGEKPNNSSGRIDNTTITRDPNITGVYQSFGLTSKNKNTTSYKMLTDIGYNDRNLVQKLTVSDVTIKGTGKDTKVISNNPRTICEGRMMQLPIISKDGKKVVAQEYIEKEKRMVTRIYNIEDDKCEIEHDLGFAAGKADFSFDGTKIVFHMAKQSSFSSEKIDQDFFSDSSLRNRLEVAVYDLKEKKIKKIEQKATSTSYFPTFNDDGSINYYYTEADNDGNNKTYIRRSEPSEFDAPLSLQEFRVQKCSRESLNQDLIDFLINIHNVACKHSINNISKYSSIAILEGLTKKQCLKFINSFKTQVFEQRQKLAKLREKLNIDKSFEKYHEIFGDKSFTIDSLKEVCQN